MTIWKEKIE